MNWDRFAAAAGAVLDGHFGEQFTFTMQATAPSGDVNLPRSTDPNRIDTTVTGIWCAPPRHFYPKARSHFPDDSALHRSGTQPSVDVADSAFPNGMPREGDLVTRTKTGITYAVARVAPADHDGRIEFILTAQRKP